MSMHYMYVLTMFEPSSGDQKAKHISRVSTAPADLDTGNHFKVTPYNSKLQK